mmetsp:Transcript_22554/g.72188  ORF Transcript_22554/g.72188 Transcript_22554/m.72188 type:complete len:624 (-) Transcript_22554:276-2147(-)
MNLDNHVSAVTAVAFGMHNIIFTAGRDKIITCWQSGKAIKIFPVMEIVEGMQLLDSRQEKGEYKLVTAGEKSELRVWEFFFDRKGGKHTMSCVQTQERNTSAAAQPYTGLVSFPDAIVALRFDNLIQFFDRSSLERKRQIVGYIDEVLDLQYLPGGRRIAMATNSEEVTLFDVDSSSSELLIGHTEIVITLDVSKSGKYVATGSKDRTCRVWETSSQRCVGLARGHTEAVGAVVFLQGQNMDGCIERAEAHRASAKRSRTGEDKTSPALVATASSDRTIKFWAVPTKNWDGEEFVCKQTIMAHDKDINAMALSPNGALLATASMDKTVKLWSAAEGEPRGTLSGHRRGVWDVQFSPIERCLASAAGDKTVRVWSIADMSCLAVLEGHAGSVLSVRYLGMGQQLASAASNGVLKVWSLKSKECISTLEHHQDKVWTLAVPRAEDGDEAALEMLSGGADSRLVVWRDCSAELAKMEADKAEEALLHEQELFASLRRREYLRAAMRALELNRPFQLRTTLETMLQANLEGQTVSAFVAALSHEQLLKLWELVRDWNMYARNSALSHALVQELLKVDVPLAVPGTAKSVLDPLAVYSERHFQRVDRLIKDSFLLDHAIACMDNGLVE